MKKGIINLSTTKPPTVELDSEAHAAYVRFSNNAVVTTLPVETEKIIVTIDMDKEGEVIGVELIGVNQFAIHHLIKAAGFEPLSPELESRTKYVPANLQPA